MWRMFFDLLVFTAGYIASVYTWPALRGFYNGAALEAQKLRDRAKALENTLGGS